MQNPGAVRSFQEGVRVATDYAKVEFVRLAHLHPEVEIILCNDGQKFPRRNYTVTMEWRCLPKHRVNRVELSVWIGIERRLACPPFFQFGRRKRDEPELDLLPTVDVPQDDRPLVSL